MNPRLWREEASVALRPLAGGDVLLSGKSRGETNEGWELAATHDKCLVSARGLGRGEGREGAHVRSYRLLVGYAPLAPPNACNK